MATDNKIIGQLTARAKSLEAELQQARMVIKSRRSGGQTRKDWAALDIQPKEEEETWYATYLDMMTLLLVLMIVMLAFAGKGDYASGDDRSGEVVLAGEGIHPGSRKTVDGSGAHLGGGLGDQTNNEGIGTGGGLDSDRRLSEMGFNELGDDIDVVLNDESVSFRINSEILFPSGQADLSLAGIAVLKKLVTVLQKNDYQIAVEGHTDSIPMRGARYPSNWELSGSRAGSVVRYFEANGIASNRLRAVGFADTKSLQSNDTAEGRAQNRRVELTMDIPKASH